MVDVDKNPELKERHRVTEGVPAFIILKQEKRITEIKRFVGFSNAEDFIKDLEK
jgi:hypothetical protein